MENGTSLSTPSFWYNCRMHPTTLLFYAIFLLVGIPSNILVLNVYTKCFQNIFGLFVKTLAILDLTNLLGFAPIYAISNFFPESNSSLLCKFILQTHNFNFYVTGLLYVTIAVQRYKQICRPSGSQITKSCAKKLIVACIVLSVLSGLPIQFIVTNVYLNVRIEMKNETVFMKVPKCDFTNESKESKSALAFISWLFLLTGCIVMSLNILYVLIGRHIKKHNSNVAGLSNENTSRTLIMTKVFGILTVVFIITFIPRIVLAYYFKELKRLPVMDLYDIQIIDLLTQIPNMNCIVNPFIYGLCSRTFRHHVREVFCRREMQQSSEIGGTTTSL